MCQHTHQPFQILRCRCQVKLLRHIPEPTESDAPQAHLLFELGKQRYNAIAGSACVVIAGCACERADRLPGRFFAVDKQFSVATRRAVRFLCAAVAPGRCRAVDVPLRPAILATVSEGLSRGTVVRVLTRLIAKVVPTKAVTLLVPSVDD